MYGMPYKDVNSMYYGAIYDQDIRVYNNIRFWNNLIPIPYRYQKLPPGLKRRRFDYRYIIPAMMVLEILQSII